MWDVYVNNMAAAVADCFPSYLPLLLLKTNWVWTETCAIQKTKNSSMASYMIAVNDSFLHQEISLLNTDISIVLYLDVTLGRKDEGETVSISTVYSHIH